MSRSRRKDKPGINEHPAHYDHYEPQYPIPEYERYEIIEGIRYDLHPAPSVKHQKISAAFFISLYSTCHSTGTILYSPIDVYLDEDNQFQPDLVYILHENEQIIKEDRIEGAPDLVLEILSPSTAQNDNIRKKRQYERFGVKEYWIADPVHCTLDQFIWENETYVLRETYGIDDTLTSPLFPCISIDLSKIFSAVRN